MRLCFCLQHSTGSDAVASADMPATITDEMDFALPDGAGLGGSTVRETCARVT